MSGPLAGVRVLVTRERPGRLAELLTERGAEVVHVPLIGIAEPADGGPAVGVVDGDNGFQPGVAIGVKRHMLVAVEHPRVFVVGVNSSEFLGQVAVDEIVGGKPLGQFA